MAVTDEHPATTTDAGTPVESDEYSLTVGPDGPILLQDNYLIEQMANFNRERIPERQPHAKGGGGFSDFQVNWSTCAVQTHGDSDRAGSRERASSRIQHVRRLEPAQAARCS